MKKFSKSFLFIVFSLLVLAIYFNNEKSAAPIQPLIFSELISNIDKGKIKKIYFYHDRVTVIDKKNQHYKTIVNPQASSILSQKILNTPIKTEHVDSYFWDFFRQTIVPSIFGILFWILFLFFFKVPGMPQKSNFKITLKKQHLFEDVAGADEAKEELKEIIDFLRNSKKFTAIGAKIPKAVLLHGAPGTGKTLLAKAVSCEAGCNFYYASGSEFEEMYVGLGASRLRSLFEEASKNAPSIIFIDEIDTIGGRRNSHQANVGDQTLNELLTQIDGFDTNQGVILIAATNRKNILDKALLRSGRLGDRIIFIPLPSFKQRESILLVHMKKIKTNTDINVSSIAKITAGFSGADLANIINEAALLAAKNNEVVVNQDHLRLATEKIGMGPESKTHILNEEEKLRTSYHESGHAIVAYLCDKQNKIYNVSIIPRGESLGHVSRVPSEDRDPNLQSKSTLLNHIKVALGGYVAEQIMFGFDEVSSGPSSDLQQATNIARSLVTRFGMSDLGLMNLENDPYENPISQEGLANIEKEINRIMNKLYKEVLYLLKDTHKNLLESLAKHLIEKESLDTEAVESFFTSYFNNNIENAYNFSKKKKKKISSNEDSISN